MVVVDHLKHLVNWLSQPSRFFLILIIAFFAVLLPGELAPAWLVPGGWLVVEIGADQGAPVQALFEARLDDVEVLPDLAGRDRARWIRHPGHRPRRGAHRNCSSSGFWRAALFESPGRRAGDRGRRRQ